MNFSTALNNRTPGSVDVYAGARGVVDEGAVLALVPEGEDAALPARRVARSVLAGRVASHVGARAGVVPGVDLD